LKKRRKKKHDHLSSFLLPFFLFLPTKKNLIVCPITRAFKSGPFEKMRGWILVIVAKFGESEKLVIAFRENMRQSGGWGGGGGEGACT
jgi:hypothetical protein